MATQEADHINGTPVIISLCFTLSLDSCHSFATFILSKFLVKNVKFFRVYGYFPSHKNLTRFWCLIRVSYISRILTRRLPQQHYSYWKDFFTTNLKNSNIKVLKKNICLNLRKQLWKIQAELSDYGLRMIWKALLITSLFWAVLEYPSLITPSFTN